MLEISQLNVAYDGSQILRNVSLSVPARQVVCLMGRNGVGKTTTLKSIVGLLKPVSGAIALDGEPLDGLRPEQRAREDEVHSHFAAHGLHARNRIDE